MDLARMRKIAGIPLTEAQLDEVTVIDDDMDLDAVMAMMDGARKGLSIVNTLTDPVMKKKHLRAIFINMNKIRAAIARRLRELEWEEAA